VRIWADFKDSFTFNLDNASIMEITKTDFLKVVSYLNDAAKLYEALPMQKCKCRAHMIKQLTEKLRKHNPSNVK